ncbi:MAG: hypothetical protein ACOYXR_02330 [Nitrospirota bacterium]
MFIVRLDGEVVTVTNTFHSAAGYADGIRGVGHRIAITSVTPDELPPALHALERRGRATRGARAADRGAA